MRVSSGGSHHGRGDRQSVNMVSRACPARQHSSPHVPRLRRRRSTSSSRPCVLRSGTSRVTGRNARLGNCFRDDHGIWWGMNAHESSQVRVAGQTICQRASMADVLSRAGFSDTPVGEFVYRLRTRDLFHSSQFFIMLLGLREDRNQFPFLKEHVHLACHKCRILCTYELRK